MASIINVDKIAEATSGSGVVIPGHVIQTVYNEFTDTTVSTTTYAYVDVTGSDLTIVTKQANSKIYLISMCPLYMESTCTGTSIGFKRGSTLIDGVNGTSGDAWQLLNGSGIVTISGIGTRQHLDAPAVAAGTSLTYKVQLGMWSAGQVTLNYAGYSHKSKFLIQEIAQ